MPASDEFQKLIDKALLRVDKTAQDAIINLTAEVLEAARTPIDKGTLLANMNPSLDVINPSFIDSAVELSPANKLTSCTALIRTLKIGNKYFLVNSTPYMNTIEYGLYKSAGGGKRNSNKTVGGFSTQAPAGVFRVSAVQWPALVAAAASANRRF